MIKRIIFSTIIAVAMFGAAAAASSSQAFISNIEGDVTIQASPTSGWYPAKNNMKLSEGASIRTAPDAQVFLAWGDGNSLKIGPLSIIRIDTLMSDAATGGAKSELSMEKGRLFAKAAKLKTPDSTFVIKTPTAIAGVRGTAFECTLEPDTKNLSVSVLEGEVYVQAGDIEVILTEGFETFVEPGGLPQEPVEIPEDRMMDMRSTSSEAAPAEQAEPVAAEPQAEPAIEPETGIDDIMETVTDQTVEETTIQNSITDIVEDMIDGCPGGGGCINGTIEF